MDNKGVREGMTVRSSDGEKLGKVIECGSSDFVIEKGFFFPKDYLVRYEQVGTVSGDEIHLLTAAQELQAAGETGVQHTGSAAAGASSFATGDAAATTGTGSMDRLREGTSAAGLSEETTRIPIAEEELTAEKTMREAGRVQVRKEVVTEHKQIDVPVMREEVHVERVPASGQPAGEASFKDDTISVPVREEEVEIRKRPVVREEVRVSKTRRQEERRADADVRREDVHVEREGDLHEGDDASTIRREPEE